MRTCRPDARTKITHILDVPPCCPVSGNPQPGSTIKITYRPESGAVMPVEDLAIMMGEYIGGLGAIRAQEEMIQHIAQRCAAVVGRVVVRADLRIKPPFGGADQLMIVKVTAMPRDTATTEAPASNERLTYDDDGCLDEVVAGTAHLERTVDNDRWFLAMRRVDGSEVAIWFRGTISLVEERPAPTTGPNAHRGER